MDIKKIRAFLAIIGLSTIAISIDGCSEEKEPSANFKEVIDDDKQGHVVVSIHYPDWFDFDFMKLHDYCYERGFTLFPAATGIPKTFRISAIGAIDESDIDDFFEIFEEFWTQEGYPKG